VILDPKKRIAGLKDSKLLTALKRESLYELIIKKSLAFAIGRAEVEEIDKLNILQATLLSMQRAVAKLLIKPSMVLIDGNQIPKLEYPAEAIIDGDQKIKAISAASILAKVTRDREMAELAKHYPGYGFEKHKGYGTKEHYENLKRLGVCEIHRKSFMPVREQLQLQQQLQQDKNFLDVSQYNDILLDNIQQKSLLYEVQQLDEALIDEVQLE
jgi:ribonuclease HII